MPTQKSVSWFEMGLTPEKNACRIPAFAFGAQVNVLLSLLSGAVLCARFVLLISNVYLMVRYCL